MAEHVRAPSAGIIHEILVAPGDSVDAKDELVVIVVMKMESLVYAPRAGTVSEVRVKQGDEVGEDDVLVVIT